MSRRVAVQYIVTGRLEAVTAVRVGGLDTSPIADLVLSRNGMGQLYLPGTSIAGALRTWWRTNRNGDSIWGRGPGDRNSGVEGDDGEASRICIEDAVVCGTIAREIRNGVGIDRFFGRAADNIKYDREVIPQGTQFSFEMNYEAATDVEPNEFARLVAALEAGHIQIGAAQTRGLGAIKLVGTKSFQRRLSTRDGMLKVLAALASDSRGAVWARPTITDLGAPKFVTIDWRPDGPLMVKAASGEGWADTVALSVQQNNARRLLLPGSSIKGAFRSHAERIMTTVLNAPALSDETSGAPRERFLRQVDRFHLVNVLFGRANAPTDKGGRNGLGRGALSFVDCHSKTALPDEHWSDAIAEKPAVKPKLSESRVERANHVAIDRWTGGAADKALFTVLEPWGITWEPITIRIDEARLAIADENHEPDTVANAARALLHLVLRDFADGQIPLGFATNRGLGAVSNVEVSGLADDWVNGLKEPWERYLESSSAADASQEATHA